MYLAVLTTSLMETMEIIKEIEAVKRSIKQHPPHATEIDVRIKNNVTSVELDALERCGMITMGRTINSRWIHIVGHRY
jgi:hypothetical protein